MAPTKYNANLVKEISKIKIHLNATSFSNMIKKWTDDKILVTGCEILKLFTRLDTFFIKPFLVFECDEPIFIKNFLRKLPYDYLIKYVRLYSQKGFLKKGDFDMKDLLYLYEHQKLDSIKFLLDNNLCNDSILYFLAENKLMFLDFYTEYVKTELNAEILQNFFMYCDKYAKRLDQVLEWIHTKTCKKNIFTDEYAEQILKHFAYNHHVLEWFDSFKKCHDCKCDIKLPPDATKIVDKLFSNKKAYNWWIQHGYDIDLHNTKRNLNFIGTRSLDLYKKHGCELVYAAYAVALYCPEKILWCKNNDIPIILHGSLNDLHYQSEFLKYYNIYDWLIQQQKLL